MGGLVELSSAARPNILQPHQTFPARPTYPSLTTKSLYGQTLWSDKRGEPERVSRKSPYKDWSEGEFVPFLNRLYGVINRKNKDGKYRMAAFNSSLVMPDFDKTLPDELKSDPECASYYIFNVANIMKQIAWWCSSHLMYNHPIHYIFAGGDKEGGNIENWFDYCWHSEQDKNYFRLNKDYTRKGYDTQWM